MKLRHSDAMINHVNKNNENENITIRIKIDTPRVNKTNVPTFFFITARYLLVLFKYIAYSLIILLYTIAVALIDLRH